MLGQRCSSTTVDSPRGGAYRSLPTNFHNSAIICINSSKVPAVPANIAGEGNFATVYKVMDKQTHEVFAAKVVAGSTYREHRDLIAKEFTVRGATFSYSEKRRTACTLAFH